MAEDSNFKYGMQLKFAKNHNKITLKSKSGNGPGLGSTQKFDSSSLIIFTMAEFQIWYAAWPKAHHRFYVERKNVGIALSQDSSRKFCGSLHYFCT